MTKEQFITMVEGSQEAFRRFLVALCCGNSALADDIAQESYIKAFLSYDNLSSLQKFNAWIYRIGYNTFINHKRQDKPFENYEDAVNITSIDSADSKYEYQELYSALNTLPSKERTSVLLYYMEGYSIKEIAEIEGTTQDAVKQHLSRGRTHLRRILSRT